MKKHILSFTMLTIIAFGFISCADDEEENTCKTCAEISSINLEICETEDNKLQYEITTGSGLLEVELTNGEITIPEDYNSIESYNCQDLLDEIDFDLSDFNVSDLL